MEVVQEKMEFDSVDTILRIFRERGASRYGTECVSQLVHALQSATLALECNASDQLIVSALLHDFGHILNSSDMPSELHADLHDFHEMRAYPWLMAHFGEEIAEPIRLHVAAKRYLCTVEPSYIESLSPTSYKSYLDQGGLMSEAEVAEFAENPYCDQALKLRRWDDLAKDPEKSTPPIEAFVEKIRACQKAQP